MDDMEELLRVIALQVFGWEIKAFPEGQFEPGPTLPS